MLTEHRLCTGSLVRRQVDMRYWQIMTLAGFIFGPFLAGAECVTRIPDVERIIAAKLPVKLHNGLVLREQDTDGRPLSFIFRYQGDYVQLQVLNSKGRQMGIFSAEVCESGTGIVIRASGHEISVSPLADGMMRASGVPFVGDFNLLNPSQGGAR